MTEAIEGPVLTPRFTEAMALALGLHRNHERKGTSIPYASHLLGVCSLVLEDGGNEDEAIAAMLHDAAEDVHPSPLHVIEHCFGEYVRQMVESCSDTLEADEKPAWFERKIAYLDHLAEQLTGARTHSGFFRVSLADKLHNLRSIATDEARFGDDLWKRFNKPVYDGDDLAATRRRTLAYYAELADLYGRPLEHGATPSWIAAELSALVDRLGGSSYRLRRPVAGEPTPFEGDPVVRI